jgi:translation elongation factor EF-1alpha
MIFRGESLLGVLDAFEPIERNENAPLRVPILDKVREMGIVFLMGKVESGIIRKKDVLVLMPGKTSVEVVALANDLTSLNMAKPGENVRIGVKGGSLSLFLFNLFFFLFLFLSFSLSFSLSLSLSLKFNIVVVYS